MKKFAKKLLAFVLAITSVTMAVNDVYAKRHKADTDKFASIPDALQICNFGSSHGEYGFNYEDLASDYNCFNFGLSGQVLSYDYRLFQYYGDHIVEGTVVFIVISYFSLFGTAEISRDEFFSKNRQYYSILPETLIKEYDYKTALYLKLLPALATDIKEVIMTLLGRSERALDRDWRKVAADIDAEKLVAGAFDPHVGNEKYYDGDGHRIENQEEIDALYALIKECQEKGAIPILITTPYLREYTDAVKENAKDFYDHFYSLIERVVQDTGVEYHDYAFDERFASEYFWFIDATHLNREGARNFTNILMREIVYAKGYYPDK